jgi:hypothetical protein
VSRHKTLVFGISGLLLALNYWLVVVRPRRCGPGDVCHADSPMMRWNRRLYWVSAGLYVAAVVVTYGGLWVLSSL